MIQYHNKIFNVFMLTDG